MSFILFVCMVTWGLTDIFFNPKDEDLPLIMTTIFFVGWVLCGEINDLGKSE